MSAQDALSVERFGPLRALQRERYLPVPAYRAGACGQGPSLYQMALEAAPKLGERAA